MSWKGYLYFLPAFLWAVLIYSLSSASPRTLQAFNWWDIFDLDKLGHFIFYSILTILILTGLWRNWHSKYSFTLLLLVSVLLAILYGALLEVLQYTHFEDRSFDVLDLIANIIGSLAGASISYFLNRRSIWIFHSQVARQDS